MSVRNFRAGILALLLFVYPIMVLSTYAIKYTETIHRVTIGKTFDETVFGSTKADALGVIGFLLLFVNLANCSLRVRLLSIAIFAVGISLYMAESPLLEIVGMVTLPSMVAIHVLRGIANNRKTGEPTTAFLLLKSISSNFDGYRVGVAFLGIIIILEAGASVRWIAYPFYSSEMYGNDLSWRFASLESALFHSMRQISPALIAIISFSFFYKWFLRDALAWISLDFRSHGARDSRDKYRTLPRTDLISNESRTRTETERGPQTASIGIKADSISPSIVATEAYKISTKASIVRRSIPLIILIAAFVSAPLLVLYPHLPGINPEASGVSTDEQYYMNWMAKVRTDSANWTETIAKAFTINKGDRPLTLLIIVTIANLTGYSDLLVVRYLPVILAPMLVLANYLFLRWSLRSENQAKIKLFAAVGAVFAVFSPQVVVGEYAGLLSNWMGLIAAYFAFHFLLKGWESQNKKDTIRSLAILFALSIVIMLVHLYTWANLIAVILLFAGISYIFTRKSVADSRLKVIVIIAIIMTTFAIDYAKASYFSTPSAAGTGSAIDANVQPQGASDRWDRLFFTLSTYVGGFLSNPFLFLLALVWMVKAKVSNGIDRLMLTMFFIMAVPITFGSIEFQTRVLYNIPIQIPALLVLFYGTARIEAKTILLHQLLIIAIILAMATYSLRSMANLYLELPPGYVLSDQFLLP